MENVNDVDLLTIVLGSKNSDKAKQALLHFNGDFKALVLASPITLKTLGFNNSHISKIKNSYELGVRVVSGEYKIKKKVVGCPGDVANILAPRMKDLPKEVFKIVLLDSQNRIKEIVDIEQGTVNYASPITREIFAKALELNATSIICAHNHPSGDSSPSIEDKAFTTNLLAAGKVLQIAVLDHLIIGEGGNYYSFADEGGLV